MVDPRYFVPSLCFVIGASAWMGMHLHRYNRLRIEGYYMIVSRFPILAVMVSVAYILSATVIVMYRTSSWDGNIVDDCGWGFTLDAILISYMAPCIISRLYLLVFTYTIQQEFVAINHRKSVLVRSDTIHSLRDESGSEGFRLMDYQVFRRPAFITLQSILTALTIGLPPLIGSANCNQNLTSLTRFLVLPAALYILTLTFMMRKTKEVMGIKTELKVTLFLILIRVLLKNIGKQLPTVGPFYIFELLSVVVVMLMFWMTIIYPQRLVKRQIEKMEEKMEVMDMLTFLTETKFGSAYFSKYLQLEFCVENLLFWNHIRDFQKKPSTAKALRMYQLYIADFSRQEVNIPSVIKHEIEDSLEGICVNPRNRAKFNSFKQRDRTKYLQHARNVSGTIQSSIASATHTTNQSDSGVEIAEDDKSRIFDKAHECVQRLLIEGPWMRFLHSEDFQNWKKVEVEMEVLMEV